MDFLTALFVQRPLHIAVVGVAFLIVWALLRSTAWGAAHRPGALLVPAIAWLVYAAWEWAIVSFSPEADIRVDLLLIWPGIAILTIWFVVRALRAA